MTDNGAGLGQRPRPGPLVCFCDIDGTLVHYPDEQEKWGSYTGSSVVPGCVMWVEKESGQRHKHLKLPVSTTGMQGVISLKTLTHLAAIRSTGTLLVLLTGARTSTLFARLPCLPAADAYVSENGGRMFYPKSVLPVAVPITEDLDWRAQHNPAAGSVAQETVPAEQRKGLLWDCYRDLQAAGFSLDAQSYTTSFRVRVDKSPGKSDQDLLTLLEQQPDGLSWVSNLGMMNVFASTSGKEAAAKHIIQHFGTTPEMSFLLCDDENDLGLAKLVKKVFVPTITSPSVKEAAKAEPDKFYLAKRSGTLGTEEVLVEVDDHVGTFILG